MPVAAVRLLLHRGGQQADHRRGAGQAAAHRRDRRRGLGALTGLGTRQRPATRSATAAIGDSRPRTRSWRSATPIQRVDAASPDEPKRLGLPVARRVPHPRQPGQLGVAAEHQIAQRARGEVRRRPRPPRRSRRRSRARWRGRDRPPGTSRATTPRTPCQARATGTPLSAGNSDSRRARSSSHRALGNRALPVGAGAEAVRHAAPADRDPPVGGALRVGVQVRAVKERLGPVPADLLPHASRRAAR